MISRDANIHEKTVQAAARGETLSLPRARPVHTPRRRPPQGVTATQAHPLALAAARRALAAGSYSRMEIVSATEIWVR